MDVPDKSTITDLPEPFQVGPLTLPNRIVMAPLTRSRAAAGNVPAQLHALYYAQRASAGHYHFRSNTDRTRRPGLHFHTGNTQQRAGRELEMRYQGSSYCRRAHRAATLARGPDFSSFLSAGRQGAIAPSAVKPDKKAYTAKGFEPIPTPRALETSEIPGIVEQYARAARNALAAGLTLSRSTQPTAT